MEKTLCRLPPELQQEVMMATGSLQDVNNAAIACKAMYSALKAREGLITYTVLSRKFDPGRLAISVAHHAAVKAPWKYSIDLAVPIPTDQTAYLNHLLLPIPAFTLPMGFYIEDFNTAIEYMSFTVAKELVTKAAHGDRYCHAPIPIEVAKVVKAFYVLDMVLHLFPRSPCMICPSTSSGLVSRPRKVRKSRSCGGMLHAKSVNRESSDDEADSDTSETSVDANNYGVWKGVRGLMDVFNGKPIKDEEKAMIRAIQSRSFVPFRRQHFQDQYRWFPIADDYHPRYPSPFYHIVIKRKALRRYNYDKSDGTAQMWLCHSIQFALSYQPTPSREFARIKRLMANVEWDIKFKFGEIWLFWSTDRARCIVGDFSQTLDDLRSIEDVTLNLNPENDDCECY
ncbi:hypothetical protein RRF57_009280 [Xylaria bambusicola]|uniref:Uncharacterized protein n=1 Tax=Xylaria bambusicola TaxID=326684 RepID=A0AAN7UWK5_9PEZI